MTELEYQTPNAAPSIEDRLAKLERRHTWRRIAALVALGGIGYTVGTVLMMGCMWMFAHLMGWLK